MISSHSLVRKLEFTDLIFNKSLVHQETKCLVKLVISITKVLHAEYSSIPCFLTFIINAVIFIVAESESDCPLRADRRTDTMANILLNLMPDEIRHELLLGGAEFELRAGESVPQEYLTGDYVFIVASGIASKLQVATSGRVSEVGMVGREGLFPLGGLLRSPNAPHMVACQLESLKGQRLRTWEFHHIIRDSAPARDLVRRYVYSFVTQMASNIVSTEQSMVTAKLARWLLMCHDRIDGDRIPVTHDMLAQMIFAHRPTVTNTLNLMREEEVIDLSRGAVTILSRDKLRGMSDGYYGLSECYWQQHIGPFGKDRLVDEVAA